MRSFSMLTFAGARDPRVPALGSMEPFKICLFCSNSTNKFYATVTKLIFCPITYCNLHFSFFELSLPDDDPVYTLKKVMEELDFSGNFLLTVQRSRRMRTVILLYGAEASITILQASWILSTSFLKNIMLFCRKMIMGQSMGWEMHRCL